MAFDLSPNTKAARASAAGERLPRDARPLRLCLLMLLTTAVAGCGSGDRQRVAVHGKVTVAGQPVEAGSIAFVPMDGNTGLTAGATIENGKYSHSGRKGADARHEPREYLRHAQNRPQGVF